MRKYISRERIKYEMEMEMQRRKLWLSSIINNLFLLPAKNIVVSASSLLRHKAKEKEGLVTLYKDMEACAGYADIRVMWEMIHSSCPPYVESRRSSKRIKFWKFCFQET